jgi:hypothetical protein
MAGKFQRSWNLFGSPKLPKSAAKGTVLYDYVLGRRFDPGAGAEVFQPAYTLPVIMFRGNGRVAGRINPTQPPMVQFNSAVGLQGFGGIQVGQLFGQPLLDPSQIGEGGDTGT